MSNNFWYDWHCIVDSINFRILSWAKGNMNKMKLLCHFQFCIKIKWIHIFIDVDNTHVKQILNFNCVFGMLNGRYANYCFVCVAELHEWNVQRVAAILFCFYSFDCIVTYQGLQLHFGFWCEPPCKMCQPKPKTIKSICTHRTVLQTFKTMNFASELHLVSLSLTCSLACFVFRQHITQNCHRTHVSIGTDDTFFSVLLSFDWHFSKN